MACICIRLLGASSNCGGSTAAALAEVEEDVGAAVGVHGRDVDATVGGVPDALLALWVAPDRREVQALALRRVRHVAETTLVAAWPRARSGGVHGGDCRPSSFLLRPFAEWQSCKDDDDNSQCDDE
uniref:Uncharacterized protein n=1 Tax=Zea mays TaxID=4577 RepID=C4J627_MAIZE|nr:unknown [Zea mays]